MCAAGWCPVGLVYELHLFNYLIRTAFFAPEHNTVPLCATPLQLVCATTELYNAIRCELLPTPNKSHYTFNLRDMGKVVQGLMRADTKTTTSQQQVSTILLCQRHQHAKQAWSNRCKHIRDCQSRHMGCAYLYGQ